MRVVIPDDWNGAFDISSEVAELRKRAEVVVVRERSPRLWDELRQAEIAVGQRERTRFSAEQLAEMPRLRMIAQIGGPDVPHIDVPAATARGVLVCCSMGAPVVAPTEVAGRTAGGNASMIEVTIGMIIAALRQFGQQDRSLHAGAWPGPTGRVMYGKTLGIVGLGRLGTGVAKAAQFFSMRVVAAGKTLTPERAAAAGVEFRSLEALFAEADVISLHVRLTDATRGLVGAELLRRMKRDAILVNTARGPVVDEAALVEALREGRIGGAALDVYDEEPLPTDHPLRSLDNALLLAHCGWPTDAGYATMIPQTLALVHAFLDGQPMNVLNPEAAGNRPA